MISLSLPAASLDAAFQFHKRLRNWKAASSRRTPKAAADFDRLKLVLYTLSFDGCNFTFSEFDLMTASRV
jgi:hypothetical protein